jgi:hypothetical protein
LDETETSLFVYIKDKSNPEKIKSMFRNGMNPDIRDSNNKTALEVAVIADNLLAVRILLEEGANTELNGSDTNDTPLMTACMCNHHEITDLLLRAGANKEATSCHSTKYTDEEDNSGLTPLMLAVMYDGAESAKHVLKAGVNLEARDANGYTALHCCLNDLLADHDCVELLLAAGAKIDAQDNEGNTTLMTAARYGLIKVVKTLLKAGADINACNKEGNTPLMIACYSKQPEAVSLLLKEGANTEVRNKRGDTAFILAAEKGGIDVIRLLSKVNINVQNNHGDTALMRVVNQDDKVDWFLWSHHYDGTECDVNLRNKNGDTALMLAARGGNTNTIKRLLDKKADINLRNKADKTALMIATEEDYPDIVELLSTKDTKPF